MLGQLRTRLLVTPSSGLPILPAQGKKSPLGIHPAQPQYRMCMHVIFGTGQRAQPELAKLKHALYAVRYVSNLLIFTGI